MGVSQQTQWLAPLSVRGFADAALTKEQVQERVIQVVKNMDKVDEGKVRKPPDITRRENATQLPRTPSAEKAEETESNRGRKKT